MQMLNKGNCNTLCYLSLYSHPYSKNSIAQKNFKKKNYLVIMYNSEEIMEKKLNETFIKEFNPLKPSV